MSLLYLCISALIFNLAFFVPLLGFLIILFPVLLFKAKPTTFTAGFLLGVLIVGPHAYWVLHVMFNHSQAAWWLSVLAYGTVVAYSAMTSGVWCAATGWILRRLTRLHKFSCALTGIFSLLGYWIFIEHFFLWPVAIPLGYPFINPCIPLAQYAWFLRGISLCAALLGNPPAGENVPCTWVAPVCNKVLNANAPWAQNAEAIGQKIYHKLIGSCGECLLSPETMFPFPLNTYPEIVKLWEMALCDNSTWLLGTVYKYKGALYQAIFCQQANEDAWPIKKIYVKKSLMPFAEYIPGYWKSIHCLQRLFGKSEHMFTVPAGTLGVEYFDITPTIRLVPRICLEFFLTQSLTEFRQYRVSGKHIVICAFINDCRFPITFRSWMSGCAALKGGLTNCSVLIVGHYGISSLPTAHKGSDKGSKSGCR